jgi:hypothetical protein
MSKNPGSADPGVFALQGRSQRHLFALNGIFFDRMGYFVPPDWGSTASLSVFWQFESLDGDLKGT